MSKRSARWIAWSLWAFGMALGLIASLLEAMNGYVTSRPIAGTVSGVIALTLGALIVSRRPSNSVGWIMLLATLMLLIGGAGNFAEQYAIYTLMTSPGALPGEAWVLILGIVCQAAGFSLLATFLLLLFPDGHLPSPRWRVVAWPGGTIIALSSLLQAFGPLQAGPVQVPNPLSVASLEAIGAAINAVFNFGLLALVPASIASVVLRFRRSVGDERQQLRWFAFGTLMIPFAAVLGVLRALYNLTWVDALGPWQLSLSGILLAVGIAVLKYRLYDIDLLINRTLVYSALTALLAAVYFGSILLLEAVVRPLTGQGHNELVVVTSTLIIAALFMPLRRRIQGFIDRRFYRRKYDAAKTLAGFSATVRDEVDLEMLAGRLVEVVEDTMQPMQVSLWLRSIEKRSEVA
ncbi:MAG: hypothetical protein ACR2M0_00410 [Chloroflexia bacterium]